MAIDHQNGKELDARVEWMMREFQDARRRRLVRVSDGAVDPRLDVAVASSSDSGCEERSPSAPAMFPNRIATKDVC
jgi:hypothetical protein